MKISRPMSVLAFLIASTLIAQDAKVTPLMSKDLAECPGKEGLMITVVYPPGASDPIHRHNAYAFLYVLEGSVVMQLKGGKEVTLTPGQTFLRRAQRHSYRWPESQQHETSEVHCVFS